MVLLKRLLMYLLSITLVVLLTKLINMYEEDRMTFGYSFSLVALAMGGYFICLIRLRF